MNRERALKGLLVLVGLLFVATVYPFYPLTMFLWSEAALAMMLSLYVTLGIFLLIAARNPWANRSLIAFTAWSSLAHAAVMAVQALRDVNERGHRRGRVRYHWCSADRAGPGEAASRARIGSRCVGAHSGRSRSLPSPR